MKNNNPKISVIVPIYNVEQYLPRCIDSILAQTFTDFELLLIDDGSNDNSGKICDKYAEKDKRIRVFHKENGGVSSARQIGLEKAKGQYSIHADGDDWLESNMLERMYKTANETKADIVISDFYSDKYGQSSYIRQQTTKTSSSEILKDILEGQLFGALWNKLIRHSLYKEYNINFIKKIDYCEDVLLLSQLLLHKVKVIFLHEAFYHYDQENQNSITRHYTRETFKIRQNYVEALSKIYTTDDKIINYVAFRVKREAFSYGLLNKNEFYHYIPTTLRSILFHKYGKKMKLCMLIAYIGFFNLAKKIWLIKI